MGNTSRKPRPSGELNYEPAPTRDRIAELGKRVVVMGDCWVVDGNRDEYASAGGKNAHRFIWESMHGPVGCDDHIHHVCQVKGCIQPNHLIRLTPEMHHVLHDAISGADLS